jgi:hypothetical protein
VEGAGADVSADLTQRKNVRVIVDTLKPGEWLKFSDIYARMPTPRLQRDATYVLMRDMVDAKQLDRRGKPKSFEYRSGSQPVIDRRTLRKGQHMPHRGRLGFCALARLRENDPEAYRREIARDRGTRL